jgi:hypothetical protein
MKKGIMLVLPLAVCLAGCSARTSSPTAPSAALTEHTPPAGTHTVYPGNGPDLIAYIAARYPDRLAGGISGDERLANMQFLRDRIIEAGKCGGMDLGWNLKRGGPELSNDFIAWRQGGGDRGVDIAFDFDDASVPLRLQWAEWPDYGASYKSFPASACE